MVQRAKIAEESPKQAHHDECEKKREQLRACFRDKFFECAWTRQKIARYYQVSYHTVEKWTQEPDQDVTIDQRGWPRGMRRVYTQQTEERIRLLHTELVDDPRAFFLGASAIDQLWRERYSDPPPALRSIGRMMHDLGLSIPRTHGGSKGAAAHLHYPEHTIYTGLGGRILESDFIGKKYITGRTAPINFFSISAKKSPKIRYYERVEAETHTILTGALGRFFLVYETPDFLKLDNGPAMIGSNKVRRTISRTARWLLARQVVPIYSVPKRPFSQASIEGSNSLFSRKFWKQREFTSLEDIDEQLHWFNESIRRYHNYMPPKKRKKRRSFKPRIYFLRQVQESPQTPEAGSINVLNECIDLPASYIKYFVMAEWDLVAERLSIHFETDKKTVVIHTQNFPINGDPLNG